MITGSKSCGANVSRGCPTATVPNLSRLSSEPSVSILSHVSVLPHVAVDFGAVNSIGGVLALSGNDSVHETVLSPARPAMMQPLVPPQILSVGDTVNVVAAVGDLRLIPNELFSAECHVALQGAQRSLLSRFDMVESMDEIADFLDREGYVLSQVAVDFCEMNGTSSAVELPVAATVSILSPARSATMLVPAAPTQFRSVDEH